MERDAVFIHSPTLDEGGYPEGCPFDSRRPGKTRKVVRSLGLLDLSHVREMASVAATREQLEWFHTAAYLDVLRAAGRGEHDFNALKMGLGTPDCPLFKDMYEYLSLAAGGSLVGAELLLTGQAEVAFNPAGGLHHAMPAAAAGFCYLNDVVLAAMAFEKAKKRVMVIDLDAHHGDGVQEAFYDSATVTTISMHESGKTLFPGTGFADEIGRGDGRGHCINIPLPVGTYDKIYYVAFEEVVLPLVERIDPDVIILELGMDALAGDPLAHLNLTNNTYADIVADIMELDKPILATGGGGYNTEATVRGWALVWSVMTSGRQEDYLSMSAGLGGVMLENTAWFGGLRDKTLLSHGGYREAVDKEIRETIAKIKETVFPLHGL